MWPNVMAHHWLSEAKAGRELTNWARSTETENKYIFGNTIVNHDGDALYCNWIYFSIDWRLSPAGDSCLYITWV